MYRRGWVAAALLAASAGIPVQAAQAAPETPAQTKVQAQADDAKARREDGVGGCIYINQLQGSHPLNDRSVIFQANVSDYYRLDFAQRCYALTYPDPKLILTPFGGEGLICQAIDLDVKVGDQGPGSIAESCIPSAFHKMTAAEIAAIPRKDLP